MKAHAAPRRYAMLVLALVMAGVAGGCQGGGGGAASPVVPVVVDTDLAADDLVALTLLLSSPALDVRAIAVSGTGEVRCPHGAEVARSFLALLGHDDVPVACGRSTPLAGAHTFPTDWRDAADAGWGLDLPAVTAPSAETPAADLLTEQLVRGGVTLLTLGPLTDVADAFRADRALVAKIDSIVIMGGAVDAAGNVTDAPNAEWNFYIDPTAANEVLAAGAPVTLVALDATSHAPVTVDFLETARANTHTQAAEVVDTLLGQNPLVRTGGAFFWDPLAAATVIDRGVLKTSETTLSVVADEGRTVRDSGGRRVELGIGADAGTFEQLLIRTVNQISADTALTVPAPPVGEATIRYDTGTCRYEGPPELAPGRVQLMFATSEPGLFAAIARLSGERTVEDVKAWIAQHPGDAAVPGVDRPVTVIERGMNYVTLTPGEWLVACGAEGGGVVVDGGFRVAAG